MTVPADGARGAHAPETTAVDGDPGAGRLRGSGARIVYEALKRDILDLALAPGSPMDEVQLSRHFAMSRTPVREALLRLAGEGLVTTLPNRSTIVSAIDLAQLPAYFDALRLMHRVTTRAAALHRTARDVEAMRGHQRAFTAAVDARDAPAMIASNRELHVAIAVAGRNAYYVDLFARLLDEGRRIARLYYSSFDDELPRQYVREHDDIIAAIEAGDVEAGDRLASGHADQVVRQIQDYIAREGAARLRL